MGNQGQVSLFSHVPRIYHASSRGAEEQRRKEREKQGECVSSDSTCQQDETRRGARLFVSKAISLRSQTVGLG